MISISTAAERFINTNFLARQKVRGSTSDSRKLFFFMVCMGLLTMMCFFIFLWARIYILEVGYQISGALENNGRLLQENRNLRTERASLRAPTRIEKIARNKLGMIIPDNTQVFTLKW